LQDCFAFDDCKPSRAYQFIQAASDAWGCWRGWSRGFGRATFSRVIRAPDLNTSPASTLDVATGVLLAGVAFYLIPYFVNNNYSWLYLLTGLGAIGISRNPEGVIGDLIARVRPGSSSRGARTRPLAPSPAASPVSQTAPVVADADV